MKTGIIVLLALAVVAFLLWTFVTRRRKSPVDDAFEELPDEGDIKPRININHSFEDPACRPLDMPDLIDGDPCAAIQEAMTELDDLQIPMPSITPTVVLPSVITITPLPKMTRAEALQAANRNREAKGRLKAQKAKKALDDKEDPAKVAAECGYRTVKYMREKVRELEREGLPA